MRKSALLSSVALLVGLTVGCGTAKNNSANGITTDVPTITASADTPAATFNFTVKNGQVTAPAAFKVTQGQDVVIKVTADVNDGVHLHGYDLKSDVSPTQGAEIKFVAKAAGRFEIELENAKKTLGELEVDPK